jgi:hypothetical protein
MKKIFCLFGILGALFISCDVDHWADSIITNDSEFHIIFKFNDTDGTYLESGESAVFKTMVYQHIEYYWPDKRVYFTYEAANSGYIGQFNTRQSWFVKVNNTTGGKVTLSADDWMDEMADIADGDDDDENHNGIIYTNSPTFSVLTESGFPASAKYSKTDTTFFVTIQ